MVYLNWSCHSMPPVYISKSSAAFVILCLEFHLKNRQNKITRTNKTNKKIENEFLVSIEWKPIHHILTQDKLTQPQTMWCNNFCSSLLYAFSFYYCFIWYKFVWKMWFVFVVCREISITTQHPNEYFCVLYFLKFQLKMDSASEWLLNGIR